MNHLKNGSRALIVGALFLSHPIEKASAAPVAPTLTSKSEGFSIWLPEKPQVGLQSRQTPGFGKISLKYYSVATPAIAFVVIPMGLPGTLKGPNTDQFFDGVQSGFTGAAGAKLVSSKKISLNGVPGRELLVTAGAKAIQGRFYAIGKKAYQIIAVMPQKDVKAKSPLVNKVFSSFRILR